MFAPILVLTAPSDPSAPTGAAAQLVGNELDGFVLDFLDNSYAIKTTSAADKIALPIANEPAGLLIDFTSDSFAIRTA